MSEEERLTILANAVHGITRPFVCGGSLVPEEAVSLRFKRGREVTIIRSEAEDDYDDSELQPLLSRARPAKFGDRTRTRFSRRVRDALQLDAKGGAFRVLGFDPEESGVLQIIRERLAPDDPNPISAELYAVNVYGVDGHFVPHKDTPRGNDMLGSLVVCLPSRFQGGELVVSHRGASETFDWSKAIDQQRESTRIHWAAFFGDVDHAIQRVWDGARVTLSYILRRGSGARARPVARRSTRERLRDAFADALADAQFFPRGTTLAFPCFHMYGRDPRLQSRLWPLNRATVLELKGRDQDIAVAALDAGLGATLQPYLAESSAESVWQLAHFPEPNAHQRLGDRVDDTDLANAVPIDWSECYEHADVTWVIPEPGLGSGSQEGGEHPAVSFFHEADYSPHGYFGNESCQTEFYVYAALHLKIPRFSKKRAATRVASLEVSSDAELRMRKAIGELGLARSRSILREMSRKVRA